MLNDTPVFLTSGELDLLYFITYCAGAAGILEPQSGEVMQVDPKATKKLITKLKLAMDNDTFAGLAEVLLDA